MGIMPHSDEAANLWERALQTHARDISAKHGVVHTPLGSTIWAAASRHNVAADTPPHGVRTRRRPLSIDSADIAPDVVVPDLRAHHLLDKHRPDGTWARWPSHTRNERAGSAGSQDRVRAFDFATHHELVRSLESVERDKQVYQAPKAAPRSRNFFDIVKDRYVHERSDLLRLERGYRSSVSTGGVLQDPDLELLPRMEPDQLLSLQHSGRRDGSSNFTNPVSSSGDDSGEFAAQMMELAGSKSQGRLAPQPESPQLPNSARAWSRVYQECVPKPPFSEAGDQDDADGESGLHSDTTVFLSPTYVPRSKRGSKSPSRRLTSSDSALDVRKSTVDFGESVRLKEMESRRSLFKAIEGIDW